MEQVNPYVGVRLVHPKQRRVHLLCGSLLQVDQDEKQLVFDSGERSVMVDRVPSFGAPLSLERVSFDVFLEARLEARQQRQELLVGIPGHRQELARILGQFLVCGHWYSDPFEVASVQVYTLITNAQVNAYKVYCTHWEAPIFPCQGLQNAFPRALCSLPRPERLPLEMGS